MNIHLAIFIKIKTTTTKNNKARLLTARLCYIDGLVSTGNQIPYTILKRIFPNRKIFPRFFINIFFYPVDKEHIFLWFCCCFFTAIKDGGFIFYSLQDYSHVMKALILLVFQKK